MLNAMSQMLTSGGGRTIAKGTAAKSPKEVAEYSLNFCTPVYLSPKFEPKEEVLASVEEEA
jgi:hypothetical protein